jgi:integrase
MSVRKRGDRYIVEFMFRGVRVYKRLPPGVGLGQARALESRLRNQIFSEVDLGKRQDPPLSGVIDEWIEERVKGRKSETQTRNHARRVVESVGRLSLCSITAAPELIQSAERFGTATEAAERAPNKRRHAKKHKGALSAATINRRLCIIKAVAKFAYQKGYLSENMSGKIQLLPENNKRHVYLSQAQVTALIDAAPDAQAKAFIAIAAYAGLRQSEVMALTLGEVSQEGLVVRDSKNGSRRIVPYVGPRIHLSALPFTRHKRTLYAAFEAAAQTLHLPYKLRYHDLRHTTASLLINSGADLYTVGKVLGHKSQQTTARYAHLSLERQREALERAFGEKLQQDSSGPEILKPLKAA